MTDITLATGRSGSSRRLIFRELDQAGYRQINAMLPPQMEPGEYQLAVHCRGEESPAETIKLAANERDEHAS